MAGALLMVAGGPGRVATPLPRFGRRSLFLMCSGGKRASVRRHVRRRSRAVAGASAGPSAGEYASNIAAESPCDAGADATLDRLTCIFALETCIRRARWIDGRLLGTPKCQKLNCGFPSRRR